MTDLTHVSNEQLQQELSARQQAARRQAIEEENARRAEARSKLQPVLDVFERGNLDSLAEELKAASTQLPSGEFDLASIVNNAARALELACQRVERRLNDLQPTELPEEPTPPEGLE